ncbi:hypothetical protein ACIOKD_27605 [Streptomyces sp. NPDC087844]|uniref:hypothetical protein n=1 Tax=Streptomyces sp. NPDC087844 TaxID=3365805 RepID=UPI00381080E3
MAERDGALLQLTGPGHGAGAGSTDAADAYARAFRTLAQHVPVVTPGAGDPGPSSRPSAASAPQPGRR